MHLQDSEDSEKRVSFQTCPIATDPSANSVWMPSAQKKTNKSFELCSQWTEKSSDNEQIDVPTLMYKRS